MQREIQLTADGSHTIAIPEMNVTYHSHHGAIGESRHVYIEAGLQHIINPPTRNPLTILEIGFGTGLNALLSLQKATHYKQPIHYTAIEPFPLTQKEIEGINHGKLLSMQEKFLQLHNASWEQDVVINEFFTIKKIQQSLQMFNPIYPIHCIYFDTFSPTEQPELWTEEIFLKMYNTLLPNGILVTYSSKSVIRRAMAAAGFIVTKIPGPWGKREMVRAVKQLVD